ncbi:hypothetical protein [Gordonia zhaorongruii]|uniref:hypothetical protein n=1 Tax=Gordonia zhaorongruii TaxID=2597659 RepID=UPI0010465CB1|nr:hypothetical protein [Gordonia zhaorongruii]
MQTQKSSVLLPTAVVLFGIGLIAALLLIVPPIRNSGTATVTVLYILSLGAPIGFLLGLVFALLSGRRSK